MFFAYKNVLPEKIKIKTEVYMEYQIRTDLAIEASLLDTGDNDSLPNGVEFEGYKTDYVSVSHIRITDDNGERAIGKPKGNYVTLEVPGLRENVSGAFGDAEKVLSDELKKLIDIKPGCTIMVVGLGNRFVTPDALGPKVIDKLLVTRHLYGVLPDEITDSMNSLCAVAPGVLGITGMETGEIIKGISDKIKPDTIIAIDALASRKTSRISTTFQIADTGIIPGSGIGNGRKALNHETLGVPVIAIGVPTVIEAAAVANDAIELLIESVRANCDEDSPLTKAIMTFDNENRYNLISEVLSPATGDMIVTPKEVDSIIDEVSGVIAQSINEAINGESAKKLGEIL